MSAPRVSVVLPTRDRRPLLQRAVESVRQQTVQDLELIVSVDGTRDDSVAWLRAEVPSALVLVSETPTGAAAARNRALRAARGEYIAFLDDDDRWRPQCLAAHLSTLEHDAGADLSFTGHVEITAQQGLHAPDTQAVLRAASPTIQMLAECVIHTMSVVVCRRALVERAGMLDETFKVVHDWEWYVRLLGSGARFVRTPGVHVVRNQSSGLVAGHRSWQLEEERVLDRFFAEHPEQREHEAMVRAFRSLLFASVALGRGDVSFGVRTLLRALVHSPTWTPRIATRKLRRRLEHRLEQPIDSRLVGWVDPVPGGERKGTR